MVVLDFPSQLLAYAFPINSPLNFLTAEPFVHLITSILVTHYSCAHGDLPPVPGAADLVESEGRREVPLSVDLRPDRRPSPPRWQ
jgi:hypothetical protein